MTGRAEILDRREGGPGRDGRARAALLALVISVAATGCDGWQTADSAIVDPTPPPLNRESHGVFFPIGAGSFHVDLDCASCHEDSTSFQRFTCVSCHAHARDVAAQRHTFITGYTWDSAECRRCHPDGQEADISRADHSAKFFPIDRGSHATKACGECHPFKTTSKTFTCTTCHAPDEASRRAHTSIPEFKYSSFACYGCHPNG